jgi:hypothetical protein
MMGFGLFMMLFVIGLPVVGLIGLGALIVFLVNSSKK